MTNPVALAAIRKAAAFRAEFVVEHCKSDEDLVALASTLITEASHIYDELGGNQLVVAQLYAAAERYQRENCGG